MKFLTSAVFGVALLPCMASTAKADSICTIPDTVTLDVLPAGCDATLTNGPFFYQNVQKQGNGNFYDIEIDQMEIFSLSTSNTNNNANVTVFLQGISNNLTAQTSQSFAGLLQTSFFQTTPGDTSYSPGTGTQNFNLIHFILPVSGFTLKLNLGDNNASAPGETSTVTSSATHTGGNYQVSSFFDIFTEFSGNGNGFNLASNDFTGNSAGPGAQFQLENFDPNSNATLAALLAPEPATSVLSAIALAAFCVSLRRKRA